jgi:hypothetical protein
MNIKHHNHNYTLTLPNSVGDRFYGQDRTRDFYHLKEMEGIIANLTNINNLNYTGAPTNGIILKGVDVAQVAGVHRLKWGAGQILARYQVTVADSWASMPPTTVGAAIPMVLDIPLRSNVLVSGTTNDNTTVNYAKLTYVPTASSNRTKALSGGTYDSELLPSYTLTTDSTPPTAFEVCIATFKTDGTTMTFLYGEERVDGIYSVTAAYTPTFVPRYVLANGTFSVNLPAVSLLTNKYARCTIKNIGTGVIIVEANGAETIDGALTYSLSVQYQTVELICTGTEWLVL